mmetsp:Transcript_7464/g.23871  ORF Transcript_7464/g.23871 Transcript_7464/m.23871 type:complete len:117 (-) Transcript_7464:1440-1790(-)
MPLGSVEKQACTSCGAPIDVDDLIIVGGTEYHRRCNPAAPAPAPVPAAKEAEACATCGQRIGPLEEKVVVNGVACHRRCSSSVSSGVIGEQKPEGGVDTDMSHLYSNQRTGDEPLW